MRETANRRRAAFLAWMKRQKTNVAAVARHSKVPPTTLYSFAAGDTLTLMATTEVHIAAAYGVSVDEIFGAALPTPQIPVAGRVGARAEVYPFDNVEPSYSVPVPPTVDQAGDYVAFEIEGFSMPPARPGWVVVFRNQNTDPAELIGYPVLVDLDDGRRLFKILRRGYEPQRWNLESWDGSEPIENVVLTACLPFVAMTPGKMAR